MSGLDVSRALALAAMWVFALPAFAANTVSLPATASQGALVIGSAQPGDEVSVNGRRVRVDARGRFVFGVGRDERGPATIQVIHADRSKQSLSVSVTPRDWQTERVNGVPQTTVTPPPAIAERIAREQAAVGKARLRDDDRGDFATDFSWPTRGRISGHFGSQRIYNGEPRSPHSGVDVAAAAGTALKAPAAGIVTFAEPDLYLTGGTVLIDHGHGVSSVFLHLSRIDVAVGDRVEVGQVFAAVGATGRATGPHMHWGINWFEVRLDPTLLPGIAQP